MGSLSPLDPSSFSRPELAVVTHISVNLDVDFAKKVLRGCATLSIDVLADIDDMILDISGLRIESIETEQGTPLRYKLSEHVPNFGSKLLISLPKTAQATEILKLRICYTTDPKASGLQWLEPSQTVGKQHPYLFSQCQPIHARSILPCQDTPAVKFTFDATVTAPEEFTVLMGAIKDVQKNRTSKFRQPVPVPAYLVALAVGVLESRRLGPRSMVWAEPEVVGSAAEEFLHTEKYLQAGEKLCGPYEWEEYNLLVLPPSFPYGGMENACLTFVTPSMIAGDKSQISLLIHEIMHSWTGNLVTNKNFQHYWLNEGFTVYLERKVDASIIEDKDESKRIRDFNSLLGLQELTESINQFGEHNPLTRLVTNLVGIHPDDAFSRVPYEKGSLFLRYFEDLVGGPEVFDPFIPAYLREYRRKSVDSDTFKAFATNYFKDNEKFKELDWDLWLHSSGTPPVIPAYDKTLVDAITKLVTTLENATAEINSNDVKDLNAQQMVHFLQQLLERKQPLPCEQLKKMGKEYNLEKNLNAEIRYRWLRLSVKSKEESLLDEVFEFLNANGRMKFTRPIYRDLYAWEEVRSRTIENFIQNEKNMMYVSAYTLRKDLHLTE